MRILKKYGYGIVFVFSMSLIAVKLNELINSYVNIEALTIAIVLGMSYNNIVHTHEILKPGIKFSFKNLLKIGIVLMGFKLNAYALSQIGSKILVMVVIYVVVALCLAILLGKVFKIDVKLAALIGVGSCICGASAVAAVGPCINAEEDETLISVAIVSFLGAIGVIAYSFIGLSSQSLSVLQYGVWSGLSLHGVAHAIAAAFALGDVSGEIGTLVKMTRVIMLVPVSVVLGKVFNNKAAGKKAGFPVYVLYFILMVIINSLNVLPMAFSGMLGKLSNILILMSMTGMGLSVDFKAILGKGLKAFCLGMILFLILSVSSLVIIKNII